MCYSWSFMRQSQTEGVPLGDCVVERGGEWTILCTVTPGSLCLLRSCHCRCWGGRSSKALSRASEQTRRAGATCPLALCLCTTAPPPACEPSRPSAAFVSMTHVHTPSSPGPRARRCAVNTEADSTGRCVGLGWSQNLEKDLQGLGWRVAGGLS